MKIIVETEDQKLAVEQVLFAICEREPWESVHVSYNLRHIAQEFCEDASVIMVQPQR